MRYELLENGVSIGMVSTNSDVQLIYSVDVCAVQRPEYTYESRGGLIGLNVRVPRRANYDAKRTAVHAVREIATRYQRAKANFALDLDMTTLNYADAILAEFSDVPGSGTIKTAVGESFGITVGEDAVTINYDSESVMDPNQFSQSIFNSLLTMRAIRAWN